MLKSFIFLSFFLIVFHGANAQNDDLQKLLESESENTKKEFTSATFKTTRIVNAHSIENTAGGVLDFRITHHFGTIERGFYDMIGLDRATMRMGLEYGINNRWMIGLGRSTFEKTIDGFTKLKLLRQGTKENGFPISVSYFGSVELKTIAFENPERKNLFSSRLYYNHQLLIARKFNERISLQVTPGVVHRNLVPATSDPNDILFIGSGGRFKLTKRVSLNIEYFYQLPGFRIKNSEGKDSKDAVAIGLDIETGGHVFQVFATNAGAITEKAFITQSFNSFTSGKILLGFCISRVFTLRKPDDFR